MSNIEEPDLEEEGGEANLEALSSSNGPIGKVTGYPPGNPNHISPQEAELRREEEKKFGKATAATRAWARASEHRAKKGGGNPKPRPGGSSAGAPGGAGGAKARSARPTQATDFQDVPLSQSVKDAAKGKLKPDTKMWAARVQLGSAILFAKAQRPDMILSEDEAQLATEAVIDLLDFYNLLNKKKMGPWGNVAYAFLMIGGPRIAKLVMERMASNNAPAPAQQHQQ